MSFLEAWKHILKESPVKESSGSSASPEKKRKEITLEDLKEGQRWNGLDGKAIRIEDGGLENGNYFDYDTSGASGSKTALNKEGLLKLLREGNYTLDTLAEEKKRAQNDDTFERSKPSVVTPPTDPQPVPLPREAAAASESVLPVDTNNTPRRESVTRPSEEIPGLKEYTEVDKAIRMHADIINNISDEIEALNEKSKDFLSDQEILRQFTLEWVTLVNEADEIATEDDVLDGMVAQKGDYKAKLPGKQENEKKLKELMERLKALREAIRMLLAGEERKRAADEVKRDVVDDVVLPIAAAASKGKASGPSSIKKTEAPSTKKEPKGKRVKIEVTEEKERDIWDELDPEIQE